MMQACVRKTRVRNKKEKNSHLSPRLLGKSTPFFFFLLSLPSLRAYFHMRVTHLSDLSIGIVVTKVFESWSLTITAVIHARQSWEVTVVTEKT